MKLQECISKLNEIHGQKEALALIVAGVSGAVFILSFLNVEMQGARWYAFFILLLSFIVSVVFEVVRASSVGSRFPHSAPPLDSGSDSGEDAPVTSPLNPTGPLKEAQEAAQLPEEEMVSNKVEAISGHRADPASGNASL